MTATHFESEATPIDPIVSATSQLVDSAIRLWDRSEAFLWALAIAGALVYAILFAGSNMGWAGAPQAFASYGLAALICTVVFGVIAGARTWDGRARPSIHLICDRGESHWGRAIGRDGKSRTVLNFRMRATNLSRRSTRVMVARLLKPRTGKPEVRVNTRNPLSGEFGDAPPMPANATREIHFMFVVDRQIGMPDRPITAIVSLSDQRGRWHKVKFENLPPLGRPT